MKKLKNYIDSLPVDKLRHRVLGQYLNPVIFIISIIVTYLIGVQFFAIPLGVALCWLTHYQIEVWQRKTGKGKYEIEDAKAGFSSAYGYASIILTIQTLTFLL